MKSYTKYKIQIILCVYKWVCLCKSVCIHEISLIFTFGISNIKQAILNLFPDY